MTRAQRNHNPVNLKFRKQRNAMGKDADEFAIFYTAQDGWIAAHRQIKLAQKRGLTVRGFIEKLAHPHENDTEKYITFVAGQLGVFDTTTLCACSVYAIAGVMAQWEGYYLSESLSDSKQKGEWHV
jgi:hypothetical protein